MRRMILTAVTCNAQAAGPAVSVQIQGQRRGRTAPGVQPRWPAWTALNDDRSFLTPQVGTRLMRDPCVCQGPDGTFHMVWTSGWWDKGIGLAHSKDLIDWSPQKWIEVMAHEPEAVNCWAPEIYYDAPTGTYLIFWATASLAASPRPSASTATAATAEY